MAENADMSGVIAAVKENTAATEKATAKPQAVTVVNDEEITAPLVDVKNEIKNSGDEQKSYFQNLGEKISAIKLGGKTVGARAAEAKEGAVALAKRTETYLKTIATGVTGMASKAKAAIAGKLPSMSTLLMLGVGGAILAMMNSPAMKALKDFLLDNVIPVIADLWDKVIKPAFAATLQFFKDIWPDLKKGIGELVTIGSKFYTEHIHPIVLWFGGKFKDFFADLKGFLADPSWSNLGTLISENKVAIGSIVALFAPGLMLSGLLASVKLIGPAIAGISKVIGVVGGAGAALSVVGIIGGVLLVVNALMDSVAAFKKVFTETGSNFEAMKAAAGEFLASLVGMPLDWIKDIVSWVAGAFGFTELEKQLDEFSFKDIIRDGVAGVFDWFKSLFADIGEIFGNVFGDMFDIDWVGIVKGMLAKIPGGGIVAGWLFDKETPEEKEAEEKRVTGIMDMMSGKKVSGAEAAPEEKLEEKAKKDIEAERIKQRNEEMLLAKKMYSLKQAEEDVAKESWYETRAQIENDRKQLELLRAEIAQMKAARADSGTNIIDAKTSTVANSTTSTTLAATSMIPGPIVGVIASAR